MPKTKRPPKHWTDEEIVRRGQEWYDQHLRSVLEASRPDAFVAIDVETGAYFLGHTDLEATEAASRQHPHGVFFLARVGHPAAYRVAVCR